MLVLGVLLPSLLVPIIIIDVILYESKSANLDDFSYTNGTYSYTFKDLERGTLEVEAGMSAFLGSIRVHIIYEGTQTLAVLSPSFRPTLIRDSYYIDHTMNITNKGDYTILATYDVTTVVLDPYDPDFDIDVTYRGPYNEDVIYGTICGGLLLGLVGAILIFVGLILLIVGPKKKKVIPEPFTRDYTFQDIRRTPVAIKSRMEKFLLKEEDDDKVEWEP